MTLTRLIPSLRTTLPDPLDINFWPEASIATTTDVLVAGLSLVRLADVCKTPCVHGGAAVVPGSFGSPSTTHSTAVVVVSVTAILTHDSGRRIIQTDAALGELRPVWSQLRLIGRASTARAGMTLVARAAEHDDSTETDDVVVVELPLDVRVGDLLAVPTLPRAYSHFLTRNIA